MPVATLLRARRLRALATAVGLLSACTSTEVTDVRIGSVEVTPVSPSVVEGETVGLTATVRDDRGTVLEGVVVKWTSADEGVATVDQSGLARGRSQGTTAIRAEFRGVEGSATLTVEAGASIEVVPDSVRIFGVEDANPAPVVVQVRNGGVGTLNDLQAEVVYGPGANGWLPVSLAATTAPTTLTLSAVTLDLALGDHAATVRLRATAGNSPVELPVTLTVSEGGPVIRLTPTALEVEAVSGTPPPGAIRVDVTNGGGGVLDGLSASVWYVGSAAGWIGASLSGTSAPAVLEVTPDASSLPEGTYQAEVRVSAPGAVNDPETLPVVLRVAPPPPSADLALSGDGPASATSGDRITYVLTVDNLGPDPALDVVVESDLPDGVTLASASGGGVASGGTVTWSLGALDPGAQHELSVTVDIDPVTTGTIVNRASVSSATHDPTAGNDRITIPTVVSSVPAADVTVAKSGPAQATTGSDITYTIVAGNRGPDTAVEVVVVDTLPTGTTFVSATGGTRDGRIVTWTLGTLPSTASDTLVVVVQIGLQQTWDRHNRAWISSSTEDPDLSNNVSQVRTKVSLSGASGTVTSRAAPTPPGRRVGPPEGALR